MICLIDTNILLRLIELESPQHDEAQTAIDQLLESGNPLYVLLQNVSEFWNVCTRPAENNGLGLTVKQADDELSKLEQVFDLLLDTEDVYKNWRELVVKFAVSGVKVHDAKIVAAMKAHNIENLLTFNTDDFKRYTDIKAVQPKDI